MAAMSNPCAPMGARVGGSPLSSGCSSSALRFNVKSAKSVSFSFGEVLGCDGGAPLSIGIKTRVVPWRTLKLQSPAPSSDQHSSSTALRCLGTLGTLLLMPVDAHARGVTMPLGRWSLPFLPCISMGSPAFEHRAGRGNFAHWAPECVSSQNTLKALVDEATGTSTDEKQYSLELQEDEELLKKKAALVVQQLAGSCIFLVGMMGSGKTTVGKHVSEALGYYFFDSDKLVEESRGKTVAEMFRYGREEEFRNAESEVLEQLSSMVRLVVATGGGAVVRPENWSYLRHGITVWLDVPVDSLAERVVAVGCHSRPLLGVQAHDSAYKQALERLTHILQERADFYASADAVVSVEELARKRGQDINSITPTMIAVQVLEEISKMLERGDRDPSLQY
ncbi:hypothetical protein AXG93_4139s1080 [Marchantia polymorpha subsp. ruderalis]|uniref:shikimate kinase n=1 Tax=Marchantia polymorpha subsp. ruderalis TaxID=1480154 RepID=A0A176VS43_MARPO|nr:hypothetical protein AXG93_4139s1080 [Marchantia polymorpha subsp. ruderalis]